MNTSDLRISSNASLNQVVFDTLRPAIIDALIVTTCLTSDASSLQEDSPSIGSREFSAGDVADNGLIVVIRSLSDFVGDGVIINVDSTGVHIECAMV
ncbi:hypothetical protein [Evtepia sp.]|uniref:hypothetical protein n=1 Tax=Evtepia sp. TaxID=2773933 RepID=UPI00399BEB57